MCARLTRKAVTAMPAPMASADAMVREGRGNVVVGFVSSLFVFVGVSVLTQNLGSIFVFLKSSHVTALISYSDKKFRKKTKEQREQKSRRAKPNSNPTKQQRVNQFSKATLCIDCFIIYFIRS